MAPSFPTHGFRRKFAPHSTHAQNHSWMSSNHSLRRLTFCPATFFKGQRSISPYKRWSHRTTTTLGSSFTAFKQSKFQEDEFKCLIPWIRASRSSLIQGECRRIGGDPVTNSGRSACNVFQHSCRPAAEAKSHPNRKSTIAPGSSLNALPSFAERPARKSHRHPILPRTQPFNMFTN